MRYFIRNDIIMKLNQKNIYRSYPLLKEFQYDNSDKIVKLLINYITKNNYY